MPAVSKLWVESEKELDDTRDGRLKALRAHLECMKDLGGLIRERVAIERKKIAPAEQSLPEFARCEAEIWLRKAEAEKK